jgi:hexulose-6-phosphate isomerase
MSAEQAPVRTAREPQLFFAVKWGMVGGDGSVLDKFELLKSIGFDGVELDSPSGLDREEVLRARDETGLPVHGVVDSIHWQKRLSSPDAKVRAEGVRGLETAIRDAKAYGGSSVLLVPGRVTGEETHEHVWERSIAGIREMLPLAAQLGIRILIENVWNGFCYVHGGPADQSADQLAQYLDEIASPWVGSYFDIGNHRKYGVPEEWIRTLGRRIVKVDVKDWGVENGWAKIGDGDVDWKAVRAALGEIGFDGWATAEVGGGGEERLREIKRRMDATLRA